MSRKIFPEFNSPAKAQDMDARKDVIPDKEATEGSIMSDNNMVLLLHSHAVIVKQGFV